MFVKNHLGTEMKGYHSKLTIIAIHLNQILTALINEGSFVGI